MPGSCFSDGAKASEKRRSAGSEWLRFLSETRPVCSVGRSRSTVAARLVDCCASAPVNTLQLVTRSRSFWSWEAKALKVSAEPRIAAERSSGLVPRNACATWALERPAFAP